MITKGRFDGLSSSLDIFYTSIAVAGIDRFSLKNPIVSVDLMPYIKGEKMSNSHEILLCRK